jgi:hypothetical protein
MKILLWMFWIAGLITMLAYSAWDAALCWLVLPVIVGIGVAVNNWCLAPLREGRRQEEINEIMEIWMRDWEFNHPDPTIPDPMPDELAQRRKMREYE